MLWPLRLLTLESKRKVYMSLTLGEYYGFMPSLRLDKEIEFLYGLKHEATTCVSKFLSSIDRSLKSPTAFPYFIN